MTIPADKIGEISLAILESIFATKICDFKNKKITNSYFDQFDESILSLIENNIKDKYEIEKIQDFILRNPLLSERRYQFIDEKAKNSFIDNFYKKNNDLRSIGSKRINQCLETYISKLNELLNNILSAESKILLQQINNSTSTIVNKIEISHQDFKKEFSDLKDIVLSNSKKNITTLSSFYNVPRKNKLFSGRTKILNDLSRKIKKHGLVFLTGPGGIGKSQIAREIVARSQENNEYEVILWISANSENELLEEFNNVAFYYHLLPDKCTDLNILLSVLSSFINSHSSSLIIYDGIDDIPINILTSKYFFQNADIIATTQNSNIDTDEFSVIPIDVFNPEESRCLLLNNTSKRQKTETDNESASFLSVLLEHYPLALEYARAYVNRMQISFEEYVAIYKKNKKEILNSSITSYKKTAYTAWKISFDKILQQSPNAKDILNIISLLDTFNIPILNIFNAQYTPYELNEAISTITGYSLFIMSKHFANTHGITQEFIRYQMYEDKEYQNYYEKTLQIFSSLLPQKITSSSERDVVRLISRHIIKLISYADNLNNEHIIRLSANIVSKLYTFGNYNEVINFIHEQVSQYNSPKYKFSICEIMIFSIQSYHYIGYDKHAFQLLSEYIQIVESAEDLSNLQKCYLLSAYKNIEGIIQKDQGNLEKCIELYLEALDFIEKMEDHSDDDQKTNILTNIGNVYRNLGQPDIALEYYEQALNCTKDDKHQLLRIYGNIGLTYKLLGNYELAIKYFQPALDYSVEIGDKRNECIGLEHLGNCHICMSQYGKAIPFLEKSLQFAQDLNLPIAKINVYYDYGCLAFYQKRYSEARQYWQLSLDQSITINYLKGIELAKYALNQLPK